MPDVKVRPSGIFWSIVAILVALTTISVMFLWVDGGKWHYWIAPILAVQVILFLFLLAFGYYWKVVRLELRGRPRSG